MGSALSDPTQFATLLAQLSQAVNDLKAQISDADRLELVKAAHRVAVSLETPREAILKATFSPVQGACLRLGIDLDLFQTLAASDEPKSLDALVAARNVDPIWAERVLRVLVGMGFLDEVDTKKFAANEITRAMTDRERIAAVKFQFDAAAPVVSRIPEYLRKTNFKHPPDPNNSPFQYGQSTKENVWSWLPLHPEVNEASLIFLEGETSARARWVDWFPVQDRLIDGFQPDNGDVMIVDIAGNRGNDLKGFQKSFPNAPGRLVLEDEAHVLATADVGGNIERVPIDLFKPQPIQGARTYYMKLIMHDWQDSQCLDILKHTRAVMKKGYSKLILEEWIPPNKNVPLLNAMWDWILFAECTSMERSEDQWTKLLADAGFQVVKFWSPPRPGLSIIEADVV